MYFMSDPQALHVTWNLIPGKLGVDLHLHRVHIPLVTSDTSSSQHKWNSIKSSSHHNWSPSLSRVMLIFWSEHLLYAEYYSVLWSPCLYKRMGTDCRYWLINWLIEFWCIVYVTVYYFYGQNYCKCQFIGLLSSSCSLQYWYLCHCYDCCFLSK